MQPCTSNCTSAEGLHFTFHLQCRSYTIIAIYITVRDGELLSYLSSLAGAGLWSLSLDGPGTGTCSIKICALVKELTTSLVRAYSSFPTCKTATQGIHRALQAKHRPLISSAQNLTIFLVSITSSPQIVSVNKDTTQKQISINTES